MMAPRSRVVRFLESPKLAVVLLIYLGAFGVLGTAIPYGGPTEPKFIEWSIKYAAVMPVIKGFGLENPFASVWFMAPALLLLVCTVLCAWRRTQVAWTRVRFERDLDAEAVDRMTARSGVAVGHGSVEDVAGALRSAGFRRQRAEGDALVASGSVYASLASPAFHWLLALLILVVIAGRTTRAEGLMGVPVGGEKPNVPASYGNVTSGPFYRWSATPDIISVPGIELDYKTGGIDRGAVPTVALKDASGAVRKEQLVYPNHALVSGPMMIHASDYGLSPSLSLLGKDGSVITTTQPLVDFSDAELLGTRVSGFDLTNEQGQPALQVGVAVHSRRADGAVVKSVAPAPKISVQATDVATGKLVASQTVGIGESVALGDGQSLRFDALGYYARLSVVDDWSVTPMYWLFFAGIFALSVSLLSVPKIAVASRSADGTLRVAVRFYRPAATTPEEVCEHVRDALPAAAGTIEEGEGSDA